MSGWMQVTLCFCFFLSKDLKNPEIVTLKNLTRESAGVYKCTASNDVGEENCTLEVKVHCKYLCVNGYVQNGILAYILLHTVPTSYCFLKIVHSMH